MRPIQVFFTGMLISFLGALPLGTLNISAMQISLSDGLRPALLFSTGALLVEVLYVRLSLVAMNRVLRQKKLLKSLEWVTLVIISALALASFYAASHPSVHRNPILSNTIHRFWLGAGMSALNPVQIPFWFGWSTVLFNRGVLRQRRSDYNLYIAGIGLGTFLGNAVFIFGGRLLVERLNANQHVLNWVIGGIFALTALIQLVRMLRHEDAISRMKEDDESRTQAAATTDN
jgi:threonine/homoserine/homoserine lactone efflux protein